MTERASNYVKKGYNTPRKIIERFAPPSENNTSAYINFVCYNDIVYPDKVLCSDGEFIRLCMRIISFESGLSFPQLLRYGICFSFLYNIYIKYNFNLKF